MKGSARGGRRVRKVPPELVRERRRRAEKRGARTSARELAVEALGELGGAEAPSARRRKSRSAQGLEVRSPTRRAAREARAQV